MLTVPGPAVTLSDGVVLLRRPGDEDVDDIVTGCRDPQVARWMTLPDPYGADDARAWLAQRATDEQWWSWPMWAITTPPSPRWSGSIGLHPDGEGAAEVGYLVAPWARGDRLAERSLRLVCAFAFGTLGLQVVTWRAYVGNEASRRVAQQVGFDIPDHAFARWGAHRGERRDCWLGTLTPEALARRGRLPDAADPTDRALTAREVQVLDLMTRGRTNQEIADDLGISTNTVKNHVRSVLEKLSARSRADAVVIGLRRGLTTLPD